MQLTVERVARSLRTRWGNWRTKALRRQVAELVRLADSQQKVIISNNCVAGILYEFAGLPKRSPTAGVYFSRATYCRFLDDLARGDIERWAEFGEAALVFKQSQNCWELRASDGEIVFLHYASPQEAIAKWRRRLVRMEGRTPIVISSVQNGTTAECILKAVAPLPYALTIDGDPAPPADRIMLNPSFLTLACDFLRGVVGAGEAKLHSQFLYRDRDFIAEDFHLNS